MNKLCSLTRIQDARKYVNGFYVMVTPLDILIHLIICKGCLKAFQKQMKLKYKTYIPKNLARALLFFSLSSTLINHGQHMQNCDGMELPFADGICQFTFMCSQPALDLSNMAVAQMCGN